MLYSRSVEYSIRALGNLAALGKGESKMARAIAEEEGLPTFFLAKTLQTLAREGILKSEKGPRGGFRLGRDAARIRLVDIVAAIDGLEKVESTHDYLPGFKPARSGLVGYLKRTTVLEVGEHMSKRRARDERKRR